jgi:phosphatidylglycerophosphatase A
MRLLCRLFSTLFGVGFFPKAPGTASSAVALLAYVLFMHRLPWPAYVAFLLALLVLGGLASAVYAAHLGQADPQHIVIDEAFGQFLALFLVPVGWLPLTAAFVFFRFFDIIKPYPIKRLERLPGGWGIMADDAGAGLAAGALVHLLLLLV